MADHFQMKMEAMKKVYAEIICNTSKEAAGRVMAAEHKARSFQQQLVSVKQESISMLLRLKDHFNEMIIESEARSLKQQMKIEELEAQLCEAEGIIVDLRGEFKQVQEQLEIMRLSQKRSLNEPIIVTNEPDRECVHQDNMPTFVYPQVSGAKSVLVHYEKEIVHPTTLNQKFCDTLDCTYPQLHTFHALNDDCSSVIMQNRETDTCRNGSTQRVCAFQGNLHNLKLDNLQSEDPKFLLNIQSRTNADEKVIRRQHANDIVSLCGEPLCSKTDQSNVKTISIGHLLQRSSCYKDQAVKSLRRSVRIGSRYREVIASWKGSRRKFRTRLPPFHGRLKQCSSILNSQSVERDPKKTKVKHMPETDNLNLSFDCENVVGAEEGNDVKTREASSDKSHTFPDDTLPDSVLVDVPISEGFGSSLYQLARNVEYTEEGNGAIVRDTSSDKSHIIPDDALLNSGLVDVPISEGSRSIHYHLAGNDRVLKSTYQRKRRSNVLGKIDENILHNRGPLKRRLENRTKGCDVEKL